jgi:uncharacterized protein (TIGR00369 family)
MEDLEALARDIIARQPFSAMLGAELLEFETGRAVLGLTLRKELLQQHGFVHGGVLGFLADNALTFAGGSLLGDSLTSEYKINYLRPASGRRLEGRASVVASGRNQAVCRCDIAAIDATDERIVAVAQGTIVRAGKRSIAG